MRTLTALFFCLCFAKNPARSQDVIITKYYDSTWLPVKSDSAFYVCDFKKQGQLYLCECFFESSKQLKRIGMKERISLHSKTYGLEVSYFPDGKIESTSAYDENGAIINRYAYYETGLIKDSVFYNEKGKTDSGFHYYASGRIKAQYVFNEKTKTEFLHAYTEAGEKINNVTYSSEAHYKSENEFRAFLAQNLNAFVPLDNNAPSGSYTVIIRFTVAKDGSITNIGAETNYGYGMEEDAIRTIKKSPKWTPAQFLGEPVESYKRQPVTYVKSEE